MSSTLGTFVLDYNMSCYYVRIRVCLLRLVRGPHDCTSYIQWQCPGSRRKDLVLSGCVTLCDTGLHVSLL